MQQSQPQIGAEQQPSRSFVENFGPTYVDRARKLREQLANLQPISQNEESITEQSGFYDVILPSQEGFMPINSLNSTGQVDPGAAHSLINNWLAENSTEEP